MARPPRAVQKAAKAANELHEKIYGKDGQPPKAAEPPEPPEPPAEPPKATEPPAEPPKEGKPAVTAEPPKGEEPPAEPPAEPPKAGGDDVWKHKYDVLNGKYRAEVPRLHEDVRKLNMQLADQNRQIQSLTDKLEEAKTRRPEPSMSKAEMKKLISDAEIEDYGDDMIEVMRKAAKEALLPEVEQLREENRLLREESDSLRQTVGNVTQTYSQNARDVVYTSLNEQVPEWKALNEDSLFLDWLSQEDTFAGRQRGELLTEAFEQNNAARVVAFFRGYLKENEAFYQAPPAAVTPTSTATTSMDNLVAPGKPRGAPADAHRGQKKVWTQGEITAFYADVRKGKFRSRPADQAKIERDIIAAGNEGRIQL
jgi:SepF-like predicted cell division protein (DUF552 family)